MTCNWKEAYGLLLPHKIKSKATRNLQEKTLSWKFLGTPGAELFAALCRWCWLSIHVNLITSRDVSRACFWDSFQRQLDLKALNYPMFNLPVNLNFEWTFGGDGTVEGGTYPKEVSWPLAYLFPVPFCFLADMRWAVLLYHAFLPQTATYIRKRPTMDSNSEPK